LSEISSISQEKTKAFSTLEYKNNINEKKAIPIPLKIIHNPKTLDEMSKKIAEFSKNSINNGKNKKYTLFVNSNKITEMKANINHCLKIFDSDLTYSKQNLDVKVKNRQVSNTKYK
jgi:4-hydroxy-3-methylbut-2-enyl diphosphate reductase IspH